MEMSLGAFCFVCNENNLDIDVYSDYTDKIAICYCGDEDFQLTEEGMKEFKEALDLKVLWNKGQKHVTILLNHLPEDEADRLEQLANKFLLACAGYVNDSLYNKWFSAA